MRAASRRPKAGGESPEWRLRRASPVSRGQSGSLRGDQKLIKLIWIVDINPNHGEQLSQQEHEAHHREPDRQSEEQAAGLPGPGGGIGGGHQASLADSDSGACSRLSGAAISM